MEKFGAFDNFKDVFMFQSNLRGMENYHVVFISIFYYPFQSNLRGMETLKYS